jgi:YD repeat-containing protein
MVMLLLRATITGLLMAAAQATAATCAPKTEEIRDAQYRLVGSIRTQSDCTQQARDRTGRLLGRYHSRSRETRDARGKLVSRGNTLPALIWASRCHGTQSGRSGASCR